MKNEINKKAVNLLVYFVIVVLAYNFVIQINMEEKIVSMLLALTPFYIAYLISWVMFPVGVRLKNKYKLSEGLAHSLAILINLVMFLMVIFVLIPLIALQFTDLIEIIPSVANSLKENVNVLINNAAANGNDVFVLVNEQFNQIFSFQTIKEYYTVIFGSVSTVTATIVGAFSSVVGVVVQIIVAYIMSFYFAKDIKRFNIKLLKFIEKKTHKQLIPITDDVSSTISAYIRGLVLDCSLVALMVTIGLTVLGVPSPLLFGVFCGLFNVIPYVGPIIGGVPVLIISLSISLPTFLLTLVVVFGTQFIEAYFLQPKIMSDAVELHPVSILVGLLIFANIFGPIGLIISTPIMATLNVLLKHSQYDINL